MQLEKIVTMCDGGHRLRLLLMARSLRAVGCALPIVVIPFAQDRFELPENATFWEVPEIFDWVDQTGISTRKRKYQVLTIKNYQYVDTDVFFLRNPELVLAPHEGLVTCCHEWSSANYGRISTPESKTILSRATTMWQRSVFCAGQFACDRALYSAAELIAMAGAPDHISTCMSPPYGDQEGINLMVSLSGVKVTNLTLPPFCMESSLAGDYPGETARYWTDEDRKPYLIHYFNRIDRLHEDRPINEVFRQLLSKDEQEQWLEESKIWHQQKVKHDEDRAGRPSKAKRLLNRLDRAARVLLRGDPA